MPLLQLKPIFRYREFHDIDLTLNWNVMIAMDLIKHNTRSSLINTDKIIK